MKKIICVMLAFVLSFTFAVTAFAKTPTTVKDALSSSGNKVWYITENGKTTKVEFFQKDGYALINGKPLFFKDEVKVVKSVSRSGATSNAVAVYTTGPVWGYIRTDYYSAEFQSDFANYTTSALAAIIAYCFGFGLSSSIATGLAGTLIGKYASRDSLDLQSKVYGNQNALNQYKYVDKYTTEGSLVKTYTRYDPPIY